MNYFKGPNSQTRSSNRLVHRPKVHVKPRTWSYYYIIHSSRQTANSRNNYFWTTWNRPKALSRQVFSTSKVGKFLLCQSELGSPGQNRWDTSRSAGRTKFCDFALKSYKILIKFDQFSTNRGKTGKLSLTLTGSSNRLLEGSSNRPASTRSTFRTKIYKSVPNFKFPGEMPRKVLYYS